ncbi:hypothetical protein JCM10207_008603 [Rhodosporidiobolus poonsookiae]
MTGALPAPGGPSELSDAPSTSSAANAPSSASSSASPSLLSKVKRRLSTRKTLKEHLPKSLRRNSEPETSASVLPNAGEVGQTETQGKGTMEQPRAYTIAPPDHRENTTLHAVMDSLPSFPSLNAPSLFLRHPTLSPRTAPSMSCFSAEGYEDSDDESPTPPMTPPESSTSPRFPSSARRGSEPPLPGTPRRGSDPSSSSSASSADPFSQLYGNVIMMGGFRGSVLRDAKTNRRLWIPLKVGFGFRKTDLGLGLEEEDERRSEETVVPGHMLCAVGGIVDLGKRLKDKLKQTSAAQHAALSQSHPSFPFSSPSPPQPADPLRPPLTFHSFGYDWRRNLDLSSAELLSLLTRLKRESAARGEGPNGEGVGATVIAHSMGGLVALHALARAPDPTVFRGFVAAGTPWQGCQNILGALKFGGPVPRNPRVGSPEVVLSWRSAFYFMPRPPATEPEDDGLQAIPGDERAPELAVERQGGLPPPVGAAKAEEGNGQLPTPGTTPPRSPLLVAGARTSSPSSSRSNSTSSGSSTTSTSAHLSSKPNLQPMPPTTALTPSTQLPPLSSLLSGCFETPAGVPIPVDFFDPSSFSRYALSPPLVGMNLSADRSPAAQGGGGGGCTEAAPRKCEEEKETTLPAAGAPGNLGERSLPLPGSPVDAAANGVDLLQQQLDKLVGLDAGKERIREAESELALGEEEERLAKQTKEEETVRAYLERNLTRAEKFHQSFLDLYDPSKAHLYPPIAILTSRATPTVRGVLASSRDKIAEEGYDKLLWAEGDGIVLYESASRLPGDPEVRGKQRGQGDDRWQGHLKGVVESTHGHVSLLGDLDSVRQCLNLLYG